MLHGLLNQSTVLFFLYMSTETTIEGWQQGRHPAQHSLKSASGILPLGKTADPSLRERERERQRERGRGRHQCVMCCVMCAWICATVSICIHSLEAVRAPPSAWHSFKTEEALPVQFVFMCHINEISRMHYWKCLWCVCMSLINVTGNIYGTLLLIFIVHLLVSDYHSWRYL